jgi:4'-phosphopantetheinyl transferase
MLNAPPAEPDTVSTASPAGLRLDRGQVDVWRVPLDEQPEDAVAACETLLAGDERERARGFYFERDRRRFTLGRGVLRTLLGAYLGREPREVAFSYGPHGKPALAEERAGSDALHFNLAHSEGLAVCAFARGSQVGIDVEKMRELPDWEQVANAVFSPAELSRLRATDASRRRDEFFRAWTRQEALLKATGVGLVGKSSPQAERAFQVHGFVPAPGFAGALAAATGTTTASFMTWRHAAPDEFRRSTPAQRVRLAQLTAHGPNPL